MNIYGYAKEKDLNEDGLMNMSEVTIVGTKEKLKKIAKFIDEYADKLYDENDHKHFCDYDKSHDRKSSDIIIMKEKEIN